MIIGELIDWATQRGYYEEIIPEDIFLSMLQSGDIKLLEYLEITERLKTIQQ